MFDKVYYKVKGLNFKKFLATLKKEEIEVYEFKKIDYNIFCLAVKQNQEKKFLSLCKKMNYTLCVENESFIKKKKNFLKRNLALSISIILIVLSLICSCNFVFTVKITGLKNLQVEEVLQVLDENGYKKNKLKSFYNLEDIELILKQNLNEISFASAIIKGNTLLININEKISNLKSPIEYKPLYAPYDMIIKQINLKSGTQIVNAGDVVKKGDALVLPYIQYVDGTQLSVEACAEIEAKIEVSNTIIYEENHNIKARSGKVIKVDYFDFLGLNLGHRGENITFNDFEVEEEQAFYFKNFLLPLKKTTKYYYELIEKNTFEPFDNVKEKLIEQNKNLLYNNLVGKNIGEITYDSTVNMVDNAYYLTTYLKTTLVF